MNVEAMVNQVDALLLSKTGKHLSDLQSAILSGSLAGQKYEAIATQTFCTEGHIKDVASDLWKQLSEILNEPINKKNLKTILKQQIVLADSLIDLPTTGSPDDIDSWPIIQDWGDAPDVAGFQGREVEQQTLQTWLVQDRCRLVLLLGMGGIGKSSLATQVAQLVMPQFEGVLWRSLRNSPPLKDLLIDLNRLLGTTPAKTVSVDPRMDLLDALRKRRWLLVLDNVESILAEGDRSGAYRQGYEGYGVLLKTIAETTHQSCCILTSREPMQGFSALTGNSLPVRSLVLQGLSPAAGQAVVEMKCPLQGTPQDWTNFIQRYGGHPLALKIVTAAITSFFDSNLTEFLDLADQQTVMFDDIRDLLQQQISRLSDRGQEILFALAIRREPVRLKTLQSNLLASGSMTDFLQEMAALEQRSLVEKIEDCYTLQPVVMEYVTTHLLTTIEQELHASIYLTSQSQWPNPNASFTRHSLVQAQAKDYIQATQVRVFLQPLIQTWVDAGISTTALKDRLWHLLEQFRHQSPRQVGYAGGNIINLLRELPGELCEADLSHLVLWNANFQAIPLHQVNLTQSDITGAQFSESLGSVLSVALSPRGDRLLAGDMKGQVHLWDLHNGQKLLSLQAHRNWVRTVTFSPDGQVIASAGFDNMIHLWSLAGQHLHTLAGHTLGVYIVAFSPMGKHLASGSADQSIRLWSVETGECLQCWDGHDDWVNAVAFSPDGSFLVSGSADGSIQLWSLETFQCCKTFQGHQHGVFAIAFHPDGKRLISGSADHSIRIWSIDNEKQENKLTGHQNWVNSVALSPDGQWLASGSSDQTIKIWNLATGQCLQTLRGHENAIWSVAFHPNGDQIASGSFDQTVKLWDSQRGQCVQTYCGYNNAIWSIAFSSDDQSLICGSTDHQIRIWTLASQACRVIDCGHQAQVSKTLFTRDNEGFISGSFDQTLKIWDLKQNRVIHTLQGHQGGVCALAMNAQGTLMASGGFDQTVVLWDVATGVCLKRLSGHTSTIWAIAFHPTQNLLASAGVDEQIRLWDLETGDCIAPLQGHNSAIWSIAFSPDGQTLFSGGVDQRIRCWDIQSGQCSGTFTGHQDWIFSIAVSPNGAWLASGGADQVIRLWTIRTGQCQMELMGHSEKVYAVTFSQDGHWLASASQDGSIRLWDTQTGQCLQTLIPMKLYEGLNITKTKGLTPAQRSTLKSYGAIEY